MFYYRDYTFDEAGWIFCLTATFSRKVCCIVTYLAEHTVIYSFTFFILYRIPFFVKKNFFKSHRNSFHVHFCHCFFILIVLMLCIIQLQELLHKFYVTQLQNIESEYYLQISPNNSVHLMRNITCCCSFTNVNDILEITYNMFFIYIHCLYLKLVGLPGLEPGIQDYESCVINLLTIGPKIKTT